MVSSDESDYPLTPDCDNFYIFFDETGTNGQKYYGFGFLWVPAGRLDDFHEAVENLQEKYDYRREIKWTKIDSRYCDFYLDLVDLFFEHNWLRFDVLRVKRSAVRRKCHNNDHHLGMRKHCTIFISSRLQAFAGGCPEKVYHMLTDQLPYPYEKSAEAMEVVVNSRLEQNFGRSPVQTLYECNSKKVPGIQLADLLLGAALEPWNRATDPKSKRGRAKYRVLDRIADYMGWPDLRSDTFPWVWKNNICHFHPYESTEREVKTRHVHPRWNLREWKGRSVRSPIPSAS